MDGIAKELVAAINGAVQNGEFREQGVVEEGRIDVYAIHFIDVEVVGVLGIDHQLVAADIAIVFDDEGVAQRGVEVFFCSWGGDGLAKDDFHGGGHAHLSGVLVHIQLTFIVSEKAFLVECWKDDFVLDGVFLRGILLGAAFQWLDEKDQRQEPRQANSEMEWLHLEN